MKPMLKPPGTKLLKLKCNTLVSTSAFTFNLRRYIKGAIHEIFGYPLVGGLYTALHHIHRFLDPRLLSYMLTCDVAGIILLFGTLPCGRGRAGRRHHVRHHRPSSRSGPLSNRAL
jgi:hypothetical protein